MDEPNSQLEQMREVLRGDRQRAERRPMRSVLTPVDARALRRGRLRRMLRGLRRR